MTKLAIDGGKPVRSSPFPPWPAFRPQDIEAAASVLRSGKVNYRTGPQGCHFEQEFASTCASRHAVAVANGTLALELALHALEIEPGAEVIVPCRSFVSSASCVVVRGATPVMVDVDRDSQTLTLQAVEQSLTPQTRAIVAVHLAGWPCEMDRIMGLAESRGLRVIEDCAQAQGARYKGRPVGSLGHVAAFSFCQDKIMTTGGEGGMITTNDLATWERAWSYRDHGRRNEPDEDKEKGLAYRWVYDTVGTNWRMTEMQSAIGRSLLTDVLSGVDRRRQIAGKLHEAFAGIPALRLTVPPPGIEHAYYRYYAFVRPERLSNAWIRDRILAAIRAEGIPCFSGCCPEIYEEKGFERYRPKHPQPIARELGQTSLAFPVHPTIQDCDVQDMIDAVEKVITHASS